MTIQELINRLEVLYDATYEDAPGEAADAVCEFLTSNGHQDIVKKYDNEMIGLLLVGYCYYNNFEIKE